MIPEPLPAAQTHHRARTPALGGFYPSPRVASAHRGIDDPARIPAGRWREALPGGQVVRLGQGSRCGSSGPGSGQCRVGAGRKPHRQSLSYWDAAEGFLRMDTEFHWTQSRIAGQMGVSQSAVANTLRILHVESDIRRQIRDAGLSERRDCC